MKNQILDILREYPTGLRLRSIGAQLGVWHIKLVGAICELENEGLVYSTPYRDMANMEFYDIWKIRG